MVGADHDRCLVEEPLARERLEHATDVLVDVRDTRVVAVDEAADVLECLEFQRNAWVFAHRLGPVRIEAVKVACRMSTASIARALEQILGEPFRKRLVHERVSIFLGRPIRRVRIPVVDMEVPGSRGTVPGEPIERPRRDQVGGLHTALAGIDDVGEARVPVPGGMSIGERADRCRPVALLAEDRSESMKADAIVIRA